MDPTDIGLFRLAERRLAWADQRQRLLAQNVANADTPGWQPRDLSPFQAVLAGPGLATTQPSHKPATGRAAGETPRPSHSRGPNGNTVSIEEQLVRVADTAAIQELSINLHRRYASMLRTAFGRPG